MRINWSQCKRKNVVSVIKGFRVEPIAFLYFIAIGIFGLTNQVGTYQVICYHTIGNDPRFDCSQLGGGDADGESGGHKHGAHSVTNGTEMTDLHQSDHHGKHGGGNHTGYAHSPQDRRNASLEMSTLKTSVNQDERAELETKVQQAAVTWYLFFSLAHSIPALFSDSILGALGDRHGRKVNIMIGLSGLMISMYPLIIIFSIKDAPLYILIISSLISGFTGFMSIIHISSFAYLADTVVDPVMLTVRMTYFSIITSVAGIFSPLIGNAFLRFMTYAQVTLVSECILVLAFLLTLLIVRQVPPAVMRKAMLEEYIKKHGHPPPPPEGKFHKSVTVSELNDTKTGASKTPVHISAKSTGPNEKGCVAELVSIWKSFLQLCKEIYHTYAKPRPSHIRLYILFSAFVYFLNVAFEGGIRSNVFSLYVQKSPFRWGANEMSTYRSVNSGLHLIGSIVGAVGLKKLFNLSDTTIILIAMGTHTIECVVFALARSTPMLYVGAATGLLADLFQPCIKSFISQLVDPDEVGKSFTAFGIATNVAHLTSNVMYSSVYRATVGWFAGFAFLLAAGLQLICMSLFFWLHLDYHYDGSAVACFKDIICIRWCRRDTVSDLKQNSSTLPLEAPTLDSSKLQVINAGDKV